MALSEKLIIRAEEAVEFYKLATPIRVIPIRGNEGWPDRFRTTRFAGCRAAWAVFDHYEKTEDVVVPSFEEMMLREAHLRMGAQAIQNIGLMPLKPEFRDGFSAVGGMLSGRADLVLAGEVDPNEEWLKIQS